MRQGADKPLEIKVVRDVIRIQSVRSRVENDIGYVMSGPADKDRLKSIARLAYEQMENRAPSRERTDATQMMSRRGS